MRSDILIFKPLVPEIPVVFRYLGPVPAGFPSPAADYTEEEIDLKNFLMPHPTSTFVMKIAGDSMIGANILPNSYVVIDRSVKPVHQSIIIAVVNGELTCKRLVRKGKQIILVPENPAYQPLTVTEEMDFVVWGVVTRLLIDATKI